VRATAAPVPTLAESVIDAFTLDALLASAAEQAAVPVDLPRSLLAAVAGCNESPDPASSAAATGLRP
jgi:hypothetical protein